MGTDAATRPATGARKRIALTIGNAAYESAPLLENATADAHGIADMLAAIGFTSVSLLDNLSCEATRRALQQFGRDAERPGYDPLAQAASGFLSLNGDPDGDPVKAPTFLGDDLAGLHAALAALAALRHRDRTGEGQHVDVSLLDAMLFQTPGYLTLGALGAPLPRLGRPHSSPCRPSAR